MNPSDPISRPLVHSRPPTPLDATPFHSSSGVGGALTPPAGTRSVGPPGLVSTPTVGALLHALKRRWFLALTLATLGAGLAIAIAYLLMPPKYVAQTMVRLDGRPARPIFNFSSGDPDVDPAIFRATQVAIVKSSAVLNSALKSEKVKGQPISFQSVQQLNKALKADFTVGPEVMTLRLSGDDPEYLGDLLNAIVDAYKKEVNGGDVDRKNDIIVGLEKNKLEFEKKLDEKRILLDKEMARMGPQQKNLDERLSLAQRKVQTVDDELRHVRTDLNREKQKAATLKAHLEKIDQERVSEREFQKAINDARSTNSRLVATMKPLFDMEAEIVIEMAKFQSYPDSAQKKSALESLQEKKERNQASIDASLKFLRADLEKEIRAERKDKLELDLSTQNIIVQQLEADQQALKAVEERCLADLDAAREALPKVPIPVQKLKDEETQILKILEQLNTAPALIKAEPTAANKITVVEPAETPTERDYSRLVKFASAGGLGTFGLVLFGVAFFEFRQRKVNTVDEVTYGLGMNVVGTMPRMPARARRPLANAEVKSTYWQSVITESVDAIRTQLLHAARTDAVHVVMVTSANGGEGKTSLASQLAASLARSWRKTLLVDGDLRNPAANKLFDLPLEPGFSEVLRGDVTVADAIKPTALSRLWLMPAGNWDAHAVQALAQEGVRAIFDQLKEQYDFIIVDSCPVLPVADSLVLGQHVDGVIFSILREVSRVPAVHAAQQKLQALGVRTIGAVVIGASDAGSIAYNYSAQAGT